MQSSARQEEYDQHKYGLRKQRKLKWSRKSGHSWFAVWTRRGRRLSCFLRMAQLILLLSSFLAQASIHITIDNWSIPENGVFELPSTTTPSAVRVGDKVTISWMPGTFHNVYRHVTPSCDQAGSTLVGIASPATYTIVADDAGRGTVTFACQVGPHCTLGMIVTFTVLEMDDLSSQPPTSDPTVEAPSNVPSVAPSTDLPSTIPSDLPSTTPSDLPSTTPSDLPSTLPSDFPSTAPSSEPSMFPTGKPSMLPSQTPSSAPTNLRSFSEMLSGREELSLFFSFLWNYTDIGATILDDDTFNDYAQMTLFAPTNTAIEMDDWVHLYSASNYWKWHLETMLKWHVVIDGSYTILDMFDGQPTILRTAYSAIEMDAIPSTDNAENVGIPLDQEDFTINGIPTTDLLASKDRLSSDGVVHITNFVLFPQSLSRPLWSQMAALDNITMIPSSLISSPSPSPSSNNGTSPAMFDTMAFTKFANLALQVGLDELLNEAVLDTGMTVLIPLDWSAVNQLLGVKTTRATVVDDEPLIDFIRSFVEAHIIIENVILHLTNITIPRLVSSQLGTTLWVTMAETMSAISQDQTESQFKHARFQISDVVVQDQLAQNGVFHAISTPLTPPNIMDQLMITDEVTPFETGWFYSLIFASLELESSPSLAQLWNVSAITLFCPLELSDEPLMIQWYQQVTNETIMLEGGGSSISGSVWNRHIQDFVFHHILLGAFVFGIDNDNDTNQYLNESDFVAVPSNQTTEVQMLSGMTYSIERQGQYVSIDNIDVVVQDIIGLDGVVHLLEQPILPKSVKYSIWDHIKWNGEWMWLADEIRRVGQGNATNTSDILDDEFELETFLSEETPLTLLVPEILSLSAFDDEQGAALFNAQDFVFRHLIRGLWFTDDDDVDDPSEIVSGGGRETRTVMSLSGHVYSVTNEYIESGETIIVIGGARITFANVLARNGVLHSIDQELQPMSPSSQPPTASNTPSQMPSSSSNPTASRTPSAMPTLSAKPSVTRSMEPSMRPSLEPSVFVASTNPSTSMPPSFEPTIEPHTFVENSVDSLPLSLSSSSATARSTNAGRWTMLVMAMFLLFNCW